MKKLVAILAIIAFLFVMSPNIIHDSSNVSHTLGIQEKTAIAEDTPQRAELNPEAITAEFMNRLKQETDENYKVLKYNRKSELVNELSEISSKKVAEYYVNGLYQEKGGSLYVIPTELPPWFEQGKEFEMSKINEDSYHMSQKVNNDLYGSYEITAGAERINNQWKITFLNVH
ncbi:hypothetical protein ACFQPF_16705 [Fictibacillus iocasae]|uniref:DUF3993 domain-containing protein n=1 Tax=Fictibacillus iocasae TaxID=2715437 RepID=A0ABW2NV93_9BACL